MVARVVNMRYELSHHAADMMRERRIDIKWVEKVLGNPELTEPDHEDLSLEHRFGKIADHGGRVLRVVVNVVQTPIKVVTVCFDRTKRGRL
jgi:hypothetical protein